MMTTLPLKSYRTLIAPEWEFINPAMDIVIVGVVTVHFWVMCMRRQQFRFISFSLIRLINCSSFFLHDNIS